MDWHSTHSRRRFMGFGIAGAVPFVGGRRLLAQQRPAIGSVRAVSDTAIAGDDPVLRQIANEVARALRTAGPNGLGLDQLRTLAAQVRVLLAHAEATGLDARVKREIGNVIDTYGRDALVAAPIDQGKIDATLRTFGFDPSTRKELPVDRAKRSELLNRLLVAGVTTDLERVELAVSAAVERERRTDGRVPAGARVLPAQCGFDWLAGELNGFAWFIGWFDPELAAIFAGCGMACELLALAFCGG